MEETIDLCVEVFDSLSLMTFQFYEMELPEVEKYQKDLRKLRSGVFF